MKNDVGRTARLLIVEDSPADQRAISRAFRKNASTTQLYFVDDGEKAIDFLKHRGAYTNPEVAPRPDLILLDLNLPRLDGRQVLEIIKMDEGLRAIPVVVLTTSCAEEDIAKSYKLGVNSFITKPVEADVLIATIHLLESYWLRIVALPRNGA